MDMETVRKISMSILIWAGFWLLAVVPGFAQQHVQQNYQQELSLFNRGFNRGGTASSIQGASLVGPPYPLHIDWKMISTPHHRLIFPEEFETEAQRLAGFVGRVQQPIQSDFGVDVPQLPLILNTSQQIANGYVTLAPRHSEWYAYNTQAQFAGPVDWYSLLALHEGRHAAQFSALRQGFTRFAGWAAGEYGWGFFAMYSMPLWFFEGDAILSETAYSTAGRGRSAAFHRQVRAIASEDVPISYSQAYLGSYRAHFPNHYYLGFPLVTYIQLTYGEDAWNSIIEKTARFSFWPLRFHKAVKKVTGHSVRRIYRDALDFLAGYFDDFGPEPEKGRGYTVVEEVPTGARGKGRWTNYLPLAFDGGGLYAVRYGDRVANALVRLDVAAPQLNGGQPYGENGGQPDGGKPDRAKATEDLIMHLPPGVRSISLRNRTAVWSEEIPHQLWSKVSTSEIIRFDLESGRRKRLTFGGAYQAPAISPDGGSIVAVRALPGGGGQLVFIDVDSGEIVDAAVPEALPEAKTDAESGAEFGAVGPWYIRQPAWSPDGRRVAVVAVQAGRSYLVEYSIEEQRWRQVLDPVSYSISDPGYYAAENGKAEYLLFISERSGTESVEAVEVDGDGHYVLVERPYAAAAPVVSSSGDLFFADYTIDGFRPAMVRLREQEFVSVQESPERGVEYVGPIAEEWGGPLTGAAAQHNLQDTEKGQKNARDDFKVQDYGPFTGLLNVHSWGAIPEPDGRVSLFAQSDDVLGRLSLMSYAGFNIRKESYDVGIQGSYRGMYPIINFGVSADTNSPGDPDARWNGMRASFGFEAPVNLSRGVWSRQLNVTTAGFLRYEQDHPDDPEKGEKLSLPVSHTLSFYNGSKAVAPADFAPPWAQYLEGSWAYVPLGDWGSRVAVNGLLTLPGLGKQHRMQLSWRSELLDGEELPLTVPTVRPRGYPFDWNDEYDRDAVASLQYSLPLLYPDMSLGNVYYLKRIRGTLFSDVGLGLPSGAAIAPGPGNGVGAEGGPGWLQDVEADLGADVHPVAGVELLFEQHFFNWPIALEAGLRFVYSWKDERFRVEETLFLLGLEW